jgi:hypothetical protein
MPTPVFKVRPAAIVGPALFAALAFSALAFAGKHFVMPTANPAKTYPAHDEHSTEGVTLGLDPYDTADKAGIFSVPYNNVGFVPIFVVITNDGNLPVSLVDVNPELITHDRTKISRATQDDIYRRIAHAPSGPSNLPLPWPKKAKGSVSQQAQDEIENAQFAARAVEPHSTQSGFMFFDVSGISVPLAGASFYLTGVLDAKGNELMYFEVPLDKYLNAPAPSGSGK